MIWPSEKSSCCVSNRTLFILFFVVSGTWMGGQEVFAQRAILTWKSVTEDTSGQLIEEPVHYNIYCDSIPAFRPNSSNFLAATSDTSFTHTDVRLGHPDKHLYYQVSAVDVWGNESAFSDTVGEVGYVLTRVRAFLQAPYDAAGDTMQTRLRQQNHLPLSSPYAGAMRSVTTMPSGAVDWVLLTLRDPATASIAGQESFLLDKSGYLTEMDGQSQVLGITGCSPGSYQIEVKHRNHVAVASRHLVSVDERTPSLFDFSADSSFYKENGTACEVESGIWGLWSGDMDQDGEVTDLDFDGWQNAAREGQRGYLPQDFNFDGDITTADYVLWYRSKHHDAITDQP